MQFSFVDRVLQLQPGVSITTLKCLSLAEEYLADHFPRFPVMPGVLMLQSMTEAGALLVGVTEDFAHSIVTLKEARNVRFADFVEPGCVLTVTAELLSIEAREVQLRTQATMGGRLATSAWLVLERYNLADSRPDLAPTDDYLKRHLKNRWSLVQPQPVEQVAAPSSLVAEFGRPPQPSQGKV
jgi:3-hydroxyacyl-[acyl-carrier-protein] dehydratase